MKVLSLLSGGMDSVTLLYWLRDQGHEVEAISFSYGQRHIRELESASNITSLLGINHTILSLPAISGSALTGQGEVPHGHYAEESMKRTVVPNRNMVMLSHATSLAIYKKLDSVAYACHAGDHAIYPDCRPKFVNAMQTAISLCDWHKLVLLTPFVHMTKGDIAKIGKELEVPYELTWTCYEGGEEPCGKCGACVERKEAMEFAGVVE